MNQKSLSEENNENCKRKISQEKRTAGRSHKNRGTIYKHWYKIDRNVSLI